MARELLLSAVMKLLALAALAMTASACTDTTTVSGDWRMAEGGAGSCRPFLWSNEAHVQISDGLTLIASEDADCDDLGFSTEIPVDVTHVRVTATDPWGGYWENSFDIHDGYLYVGVILFTHDDSGD